MAKLFDSLLAAPVLRTFVQYLIAFCSRLQAAYDVISGVFVRPIVPDKSIQFRDPRLEHRPEAASDIISSVGIAHARKI